jgi:hypothetical protein
MKLREEDEVVLGRRSRDVQRLSDQPTTVASEMRESGEELEKTGTERNE